ncbi:hypothetical protein LCGC14_1734250, partial [marine sediment metagenome]
ILKEDKKKLIQKRVENFDPRIFELFVIFKRFIGIHDNYSKNWMEQSIILEGKKTVKRLHQSLENIKKKNAIHQILNQKNSSIQDLKENLKLNLYNNTILNLKEKKIIIKIIQKETLSEDDKTKLISVLSKLPTKELISLLGEDFKPEEKSKISKIKISHFRHSYNTLELIEDLKREIEQIAPTHVIVNGKQVKTLFGGKLSENKLGIFLGKTVTYIKDNLKKQIKRNHEYIISLEVLEGYAASLTEFFGEKVQNALRFIEQYKSINNPMKSTKYQIYKYHPNFKIDYFNQMNTKEKAYWLGFLYADGWAINERGLFRMGLQLGEKDRSQLVRFCEALGLDPTLIKPKTTKLNYKGEIREYLGYRIRFKNSKMAEDLQELGLVERKSKIIELIDLGSDELNLAFLLGFYDGEGTEGTTKITSGSRKFLQQIKEKYNLPFKLSKREGKDVWVLSLGSDLFNDMMANYGFSMGRKRKEFEVRRYGVKEGFKKLMTRELLQKLVFEKSIAKIAEEYGVWHQYVTSLIEEWHIETPPPGYWSLKKNLGLAPPTTKKSYGDKFGDLLS